MVPLLIYVNVSVPLYIYSNKGDSYSLPCTLHAETVHLWFTNLHIYIIRHVNEGRRRLNYHIMFISFIYFFSETLELKEKAKRYIYLVLSHSLFFLLHFPVLQISSDKFRMRTIFINFQTQQNCSPVGGRNSHRQFTTWRACSLVFPPTTTYMYIFFSSPLPSSLSFSSYTTTSTCSQRHY